MKTKGFTLVELLVVIAILAILATVSVVGYTNYIKNANESLALQELSQVKSSILAEDIVNNDFAIGSDGKVNAEGEDAFNDYLEDLANGLNGNLEYVDGTVVYTLEKDTSVVYVLDLKTGEVEAGTATQNPVTPPAGEGEVCESICAECGKCTDTNCDDANHTEKCGGHTVAPTTVTASKSHTEIATIAGVTAGQTTGKIDGVEIKLDDNITIKCDKGNAGTVPTIYTESIRLYQNGSTLTIKAAEGCTMTTIVLTLANKADGDGPIDVNGGTASELTDHKYTITVNEGVSEVVITTTGTDSSSRVYVANIEVTYTK